MHGAWFSVARVYISIDLTLKFSLYRAVYANVTIIDKINSSYKIGLTPHETQTAIVLTNIRFNKRRYLTTIIVLRGGITTITSYPTSLRQLAA